MYMIMVNYNNIDGIITFWEYYIIIDRLNIVLVSNPTGNRVLPRDKRYFISCCLWKHPQI